MVWACGGGSTSAWKRQENLDGEDDIELYLKECGGVSQAERKRKGFQIKEHRPGRKKPCCLFRDCEDVSTSSLFG